MDTKWKNISRNVLLWICIVVSCVAVYVPFVKIVNEFAVMEQTKLEDRYACMPDFDNIMKQATVNESWDAITYAAEKGEAWAAESLQKGKLVKQENISFDGKVIFKNGKEQTYHSEDQAKENAIPMEITYSDTRITMEHLYSSFWNEYWDDSLKDSKIKKIEGNAYVTLPEEYRTLYQEHTTMINGWIDYICYGLGALLLCLIAMIFLLDPKKKSKAGAWMDRIWLEILVGISIAAIVGATGLGFGKAYLSLGEYTNLRPSLVHSYNVIFVGSMLLCLACYASVIRRIKERNFFGSSIIIRSLRFTRKTIVDQAKEWNDLKKKESNTLKFKEKVLKRKRINIYLTGVTGLAAFIGFALYSIWVEGVAILICGGLGIFLIWFLRRIRQDYRKDLRDLMDFEKVLQQISEISDGNLRAVTDIEPTSLYYNATKKLEGIGNGMEKSVEDRLKGERMKVELITNVSHDLKTPLTAIISYVDLLSKEELSPEARDYVMILQKKADNLKRTVVDLFELAKTSSGDVQVNVETLDLKRLIEQILAEMDDQIAESELEIIKNMNVEQALFDGDTNRMYRVVQNVMENALKYSMKGTRVFINIEETEREWKCSFINTAAYYMNFTAEEILERFTRGDKARTTEGSGLGLSIAKSFTEVCGGKFDIQITGDQFRVEIRFPKKV